MKKYWIYFLTETLFSLWTELIHSAFSNLFCSKSSITIVTFVRFLSFMNWFIVPSQFCFEVKSAAQTLHLEAFFPSWYDMAFQPYFAVKAFFPSWTDAMCWFNWDFWAKLTTQILHWNIFFHSWTDAICLLSFFQLQIRNCIHHIWGICLPNGQRKLFHFFVVLETFQVNGSFFIPIFSPCTKNKCRSNECLFYQIVKNIYRKPNSSTWFCWFYVNFVEIWKWYKNVYKCRGTANKTILKNKPRNLVQ